VGVENFCTKLPKGTPLRQIWSNKSFGVCGSDVVLTLYGGEKKSTPLENRVVYSIRHRYVAQTAKVLAYAVHVNHRKIESDNDIF